MRITWARRFLVLGLLADEIEGGLHIGEGDTLMRTGEAPRTGTRTPASIHGLNRADGFSGRPPDARSLSSGGSRFVVAILRKADDVLGRKGPEELFNRLQAKGSGEGEQPVHPGASNACLDLLEIGSIHATLP